MDFVFIVFIYLVLGLILFSWVIDDYKHYLERRELNIRPASIVEYTHNDLYDLAERMGGHRIRKGSIVKPLLIVMMLSALVIPCLIINAIHFFILDR